MLHYWWHDFCHFDSSVKVGYGTMSGLQQIFEHCRIWAGLLCRAKTTHQGRLQKTCATTEAACHLAKLLVLPCFRCDSIADGMLYTDDASASVLPACMSHKSSSSSKGLSVKQANQPVDEQDMLATWLVCHTRAVAARACL